MKDRLLLLGYLAAVVTATVVHDPLLLAMAAFVIALSAGRNARSLTTRALRAALPFLLAVNLGYLLVVRDDLASAGRVLPLVNARMICLVLLAFRVLPAVDLQRALGFSPTLRFVLILATSQVLAFRRLFADFAQALAARTTRRPGLRTSLRQGAAMGAFFLRRAEHDATEITQALTARGFFLDRD